MVGNNCGLVRHLKQGHAEGMNCPFAFEQPSGRPHRWMVVSNDRKLSKLQNPAYRPTHCYPNIYSSRCNEPVFRNLERRVLSESAKYRQAMMHATKPSSSSGKLSVPRSTDGIDLSPRAMPVNGHQKVFVAENAPSKIKCINKPIGIARSL